MRSATGSPPRGAATISRAHRPDTSVSTSTYDANGNQLSTGADTFSSDATNRLNGATVDGVASMYAYLGDGRRASAGQGGVTTSFVWDPNVGLPQLALERDAVGATLRTTTYGLGPLSVSEGGQTSYLHVFQGGGSIEEPLRGK